ncbi:MAG TPA: HAD family hydrolase [Flavitalea sp.]|nr:HAD family hydrolase [Flavitalea sp.]
MLKNKNKAIFLDKDGTLIPDIPFNTDPALITLSQGAAEGCRLLVQQGFRIIVVANQPGMAHGYCTPEALERIRGTIQLLLAKEEIPLHGFYFCPHHPKGIVPEYSIQCWCRKPKPGMLLQACMDQQIDIKSSWMIGDTLDDIEAGKKAGCRTILIDNGNETEWNLTKSRSPHFTCSNLREAAELITQQPFAETSITS